MRQKVRWKAKSQSIPCCQAERGHRLSLTWQFLFNGTVLPTSMPAYLQDHQEITVEQGEKRDGMWLWVCRLFKLLSWECSPTCSLVLSVTNCVSHWAALDLPSLPVGSNFTPSHSMSSCINFLLLLFCFCSNKLQHPDKEHILWHTEWR